jgi:hypothetical protein
VGLIGNYSVLSKHPGRDIGGGAIGLGNNRSDFGKTSQMAGAFSGASWDSLSGRPDGYRPPYTWGLPRVAGGLSARGNTLGEGDLTGAIAGGKNAEATLSGVGTLVGTLQLVVSLVASIGGSGTISGAALLAYLQLAATLAGTGDLTGARTAIAHAAAVADGSGTIAGTTVATALGELAAAITVTGTGLTTGNVGAAVWSAIAASNNDPGTMGEKLNDAGSASNPWTEVIESGFTAAQILRLIAAAVQGNATGLEDGTPTFKGLDGATDRITATYNSGTRTVTDRDAD